MTEDHGEMMAPVENKPNIVSRVASRVGEFLARTYTVKGATQAELKKYADTYNAFTGAQREEIMRYYEQKVHGTAVRKVIFNTVATGAAVTGLTLTGAAVWAPESFLGKFAIGIGKGAVELATNVGAGIAGWAKEVYGGIKTVVESAAPLKAKIGDIFYAIIHGGKLPPVKEFNFPGKL